MNSPYFYLLKIDDDYVDLGMRHTLHIGCCFSNEFIYLCVCYGVCCWVVDFSSWVKYML